MKKLLLALACLSFGCSSYDLATPTQDLLVGKWNLTSVGGTPLPYAPPQAGLRKQEVVADVLTLAAPDTFTEVTSIRDTQNGQVTTQTITDSGTYEFNSYVVTFHFQSDGTTGSGTLTGRTMKIIASGIAFSYEKQR
jgi:hypothetical protein